jgi:UDP-N-acetylglucosamine 3-dehydrogenase
MTTMKSYRAAIVGAGKPVATNHKGGGYQIGYTHARAYQRHPRVSLVAVADIAPAHIDAFNEQFDTSGYTSYVDMLQHVRPDIVSICTYVGLHADIIEAAVAAGVSAIFCEKPFVATPAQLQRIAAVLKHSPVQLSVAHVRRYLPVFQQVRTWITQGHIGTPVACLAGIAGWDLSEWGSHWIDMFRFLLAEEPVSWVMGQARVRDTRGFGHTMEEHATLHMGFASGARGILDGGQALAGGDIMTIVGNTGVIHIHNEQRATLTTPNGQQAVDFSTAMTWDGCWDAAVTDIVTWLDGGAVARIGYPHVAESAAVNLAAYVSVLERDRIDMPLQSTLDVWPLEPLARTDSAQSGAMH